MLVVVNQPHTEGFRIEGRIPASVLTYMNKEFGKENVTVRNDKDEELVDFREMDWYKEIKQEMTPEENLKFYRKLVHMTQPELAEKLGVSKQAVSNMEHGSRAISKKMAKELAKIFDVDVSKFI